MGSFVFFCVYGGHKVGGSMLIYECLIILFYVYVVYIVFIVVSVMFLCIYRYLDGYFNHVYLL